MQPGKVYDVFATLFDLETQDAEPLSRKTVYHGTERR